MKIVSLILTFFLTLSFFSCNTLENGREWLNKMQGETTIDINGAWISDEWGTAYFIQKEGTLTGTISSYEIIGSIKGEKVFLVITYSGEFYYSAILQYKKNLLTGHYCYSTLDDEELPRKSYPIILIRSKEL